MVALETVSIADGDIAVTYLQQVGADPHLTTPDRAAQIDAVASQIADFIGEARSTIDVAIYDFRLRDEAARIVSGALRAAVKRGVAIRIAYDAVTNAGNEQARPTVPVNIEADKKSPGTETFVSSFTDIAEIRPITGYRVLMHNKYIIRDGLSADAAVFTGSAKIPAIHRASNSALSRMNQVLLRKSRRWYRSTACSPTRRASAAISTRCEYCRGRDRRDPRDAVVHRRAHQHDADHRVGRDLFLRFGGGELGLSHGERDFSSRNARPRDRGGLCGRHRDRRHRRAVAVRRADRYRLALVLVPRLRGRCGAHAVGGRRRDRHGRRLPQRHLAFCNVLQDA